MRMNRDRENNQVVTFLQQHVFTISTVGYQLSDRVTCNAPASEETLNAVTPAVCRQLKRGMDTDKKKDTENRKDMK